jgi:hypothetical protein
VKRDTGSGRINCVKSLREERLFLSLRDAGFKGKEREEICLKKGILIILPNINYRKMKQPKETMIVIEFKTIVF